jgi:TRAP transporter T-component
MKVFYFIVFLMLMTSACSTQKMAVRLALPLVEGQYVSLQEESDPHLAENAIPANLKMMEGFLKEDENNSTLLIRLSEGFCGYSFSFVEESDPDRASALYLRGKKYALRALAAQTDIKNIDTLKLDQLNAAMAKTENENVPALFWLGQCWGGWLMLSMDDPKAFADISKVESLMKRVLELDASFNYAGPHLFLGAFYGGRSKLLGGDPEKSRYHFEQSLALTGNRFLLSRVMYAKTYAVQVQDKKLFQEQLNAVIKSTGNILPEQRLANEVAKLKAKRLLEMADELF